MQNLRASAPGHGAASGASFIHPCLRSLAGINQHCSTSTAAVLGTTPAAGQWPEPLHLGLPRRRLPRPLGRLYLHQQAVRDGREPRLAGWLAGRAGQGTCARMHWGRRQAVALRLLVHRSPHPCPRPHSLPRPPALFSPLCSAYCYGGVKVECKDGTACTGPAGPNCCEPILLDDNKGSGDACTGSACKPGEPASGDGSVVIHTCSNSDWKCLDDK